MRALKYLRAIIKIQAWWRGVMARKSYARQKMMKKGKGKRKKQAVIDKNALNNEKQGSIAKGVLSVFDKF